MQISYKLEGFNSKKIINSFGLNDKGKAELFLANACARRMQKYVPWKTGTLAKNTTIEPGKVTYNQPYAYYQFRGYTKGPVRNYSNQNGLRQKRWHLPMIANERDPLTREVENYIKSLKG